MPSAPAKRSAEERTFVGRCAAPCYRRTGFNRIERIVRDASLSVPLPASDGLLLAAIAAAAAAAEPSFVPVFRDNFPDPHIVEHQGEFIAYATNAGINLPMLTSRDLVHWTWVTPATRQKRLRRNARRSRPG